MLTSESRALRIFVVSLLVVLSSALMALTLHGTMTDGLLTSIAQSLAAVMLGVTAVLAIDVAYDAKPARVVPVAIRIDAYRKTGT